tara:strand:+ start:151 stop:738 length:588 start_codon:yes stop_codon:yes gene_type:complete
MIDGDSLEYELLERWSKGFDCQGYKSCEIGVCKGYGSKVIMDNVLNNYIHVGVDPYGDLEYQHFDNQKNYQWKGYEPGVAPTYPDTMRDTLLYDFKPYRNKGKFTLCNMTDIDFMTISKHKDSKFAFVHFDGPHMTKDVITEAVWFANRSAPHTRFVFDDYTMYNMNLIADVMKYYGFEGLEKGKNKVCLEKNES